MKMDAGDYSFDGKVHYLPCKTSLIADHPEECQ